jgi:hypothetical protein
VVALSLLVIPDIVIWTSLNLARQKTGYTSRRSQSLVRHEFKVRPETAGYVS